MSDHYLSIDYNQYRDNRYLFFSVSGLGDLVLLHTIIMSILKNNNIVYDIVVRKDHIDFIKHILPEAKIYFANTNEEKHLEEYYYENVDQNNSNIIFFNKRKVILNSRDYMINTVFNNVYFSLDNSFFKKNESIIESIYSIFNIGKQENIVVISPTSHGFEKSLNIKTINKIIDFLIKDGYFVICVSPCVYYNSNRFVNLYYKIKPLTLMHILLISKFLITIDTGPMHLSCLARIPFCAFFNLTYSRSILDYVYNSNWRNFSCYDIGENEEGIIEKVEEFKNDHSLR